MYPQGYGYHRLGIAVLNRRSGYNYQYIISFRISSWGDVPKSHRLHIEDAQSDVLKAPNPCRFPTNIIYEQFQIDTSKEYFINSAYHRLYVSGEIIVCSQMKWMNEWKKRTSIYIGKYLINWKVKYASLRIIQKILGKPSQLIYINVS